VKSAVFAALFAFCCSAAAHDQFLMPPEILDLFNAHHCDAVDDYIDSAQAPDNPPLDYQSWPVD
jgi:hypothetical protein